MENIVGIQQGRGGLFEIFCVDISRSMWYVIPVFQSISCFIPPNFIDQNNFVVCQIGSTKKIIISGSTIKRIIMSKQ